MNTIENLVFEGGGVKGIAYAGALQVLEQRNLLSNLQRVAGTSAGAITSCLVSLGYSGAQIESIIQTMDVGSLEDHENIFKKFKDYGLHPGDAFLAWMQTQITQAGKGLKETATFTDFKNAGCKDLHVFATDIYTHSLREFSFAATPDTIVAEAIRASMSIPLFFNAFQFSNHQPDDHLFVDGGVLYNYPIDIFDTPAGMNMATLGFRLEDLQGQSPLNAFGLNNWPKYIENTFATLLQSQSIMFHKNPEEMKRTIIIDDLGVSAVNFDLDQATKSALVKSGQDATTSFLDKNVA